MTKFRTLICFTFVLAVSGLVFTACQNAFGPDKPAAKTGSVSGKALFSNSDDHSGITVTLERTDGLRSLAAVEAARDIASGARSVGGARVVAGTAKTGSDGLYTFNNLAPGTYTVYATSPDSTEKAMVNVTVAAGRAVTAEDLNLTPTGSITGRIKLDGNETGNFGFLVSVAGTSYMAVSDNDGYFTISDIPVGNNYLIIIIKGNYTGVWTTDPQSVTGGGEPTNLGTKTINSADLDRGIIWKGALASAPANPQLNWAYLNTEDKTMYIWNGTGWDVLGAQGEKGDDGVPFTWKGEYANAALLIAANGSPQLNWAYYNSTDKKSYIYNGTAWQEMVKDGTIGPQGPQGDPSEPGNDGVSITWKGEYETLATLTAAEGSPQKNWAYYNITDKMSYFYDGSIWQILAKDGESGDGIGAVLLINGVWKDGGLTKADGVDVYRITVTEGVSYYIWWNDAFDGPYPVNKTGVVEVRAMYSDESEIFDWTEKGWTDPQEFTATRTGIVYVEVRPYDASVSFIGTYGIALSVSSIRPGTAVSETALVDSVWANGTLADKDSLGVYTIAVTGGTEYNIWWNDKLAGDGTKTADVQVQARYGDDRLIFGTDSSPWVDVGWTAPQTFTATRTGTVYVRVRPLNGGIDKTGTYGVVFSTGSTRPGSGSIDYDNAVTLVNNQWANGNLPGANSIDVYKFDVSGGQTYSVWWDQSGSKGGGSKTATVHVRAEYGDNSAIFDWQDDGWTGSDNTITPAANGIVYVIVRPYNELGYNTGAYGIVYSTSNTIPLKDSVIFEGVSAAAGTPTPSLTLTFDKAIPGFSAADITLSGLPGVSKGTLGGSGPEYTLPISGFSLGGTLTVAVGKTLYDISNPTKTVTVSGTGGTVITLVENQWADGDLPNASDVHWYSIAVTGGRTYNVWWNERGAYGNGTKTADLDVLAEYADGSAVAGWPEPVDGAWLAAKSFTADYTGTVYVRVRPYNGSDSFKGTYGIVYSTGNTRPIIRSPDDKPVTFSSVSAVGSPITTALTLTLSEAITDLSENDIFLSGIINVRKGTLIGSGPEYTLPIYGFPSSGTLTVTVEKLGYDITSDSPRTVTISRASPASLVENQWVNGDVPAVSSEDWYTIAVTQDATYYVWWNDGEISIGGDGTKTADIQVIAYYSDGSEIAGWTIPANAAWNAPKSFTAASTGTVYVWVRPYNGPDYTGTYGIVFSTVNTRP